MVLLFYIAKLILASGIFYSYYWLFLRNQQFHRYNRFYLLITASLSIIIPFLKIPVGLFSSNAENAAFIKTLRVIAVNEWEEPVTIYASRNNWSHFFNMQNGFLLLYATGVIIGLFFLIRSLLYVLGLKRKYPQEIFHHIQFYNTAEKGTPFSFFRAIFWNREIPFDTKQGQQIFRHELYHVKEKHSADIMLLEMLCCIGWFNPFFHLIKKEINAIHEFLADAYAVSLNNRHEYAELLVLHAIQQKNPGLTNQFFHNQIKRRINMIIHSNLVRRSGYSSRIMALPLLFLLVSAFAVKLTNTSLNNSLTGKNTLPMTVIIDAGHGGSDNGTISNDGRLKEKNIALSIAQEIKKLSTGYNLNVVLTRNNDAFVRNAATHEEDLMNRVTITEETKADIFVSIHVNASVDKISNNSGFEAAISNRRDDTKSRQLASALLMGLKNIYPVSEKIQQREVGIVVLDKNTCPAVILECGYINNSKDAAFITNADNQEKIARNILEGIITYSNAQSPSTAYVGETAMITGPNNGWISDTASSGYLANNGSDNKKEKYLIQKQQEVEKDIALFNTRNSGVVKKPNDPSLEGLTNESTFLTERLDLLKKQANQDKTYKKIEIEPDFPGGRSGWITYLASHLKYPQKAQDKEVQGTVLIQFIIDKDGNTSDVKAISGPKELREESVRVIKESGKWIPAVEKGQKVKAYKRQPITYRLEVQNVN